MHIWGINSQLSKTKHTESMNRHTEGSDVETAQKNSIKGQNQKVNTETTNGIRCLPSQPLLHYWSIPTCSYIYSLELTDF